MQNNNVFYCTVDANGLGTPLAVTTDGLWNFVINGAPDWLYEEEILGSNSALWWAPDSAHFAFIKYAVTSERARDAAANLLTCSTIIHSSNRSSLIDLFVGSTRAKSMSIRSQSMAPSSIPRTLCTSIPAYVDAAAAAPHS